MERRERCLLCFLAVAVLFLTVGASPLWAQTTAPPVVLKAVSGGTKGWVFNDLYLQWIKRVNERAGGRLKFEFTGGPEVFPALEQLDPLKRGVIDSIVTPASYVTGALPELHANDLLFDASDPAKAREIGLSERLDRVTREKAGVAFVGATMWLPFSVYVNKPLEKADLRGIKMRSISLYDPVLKALGAGTVSLPPAEIAPALQTGIVDGLAWPALFVVGPGYARFLKYKVMPWWWQSVNGLVLMNARSFDAMLPDLRKLLMDTMKEIEREARPYYQAKERAEDEQLKRMGMKVLTLPAAEVEKVKRIHWEEGVKLFLTGPSPKHGPELRDLIAPFAPR